MMIDEDLQQRISFSIRDFEDDFVGWINMYARNSRHGTFSFEISIFREYRRKGYAEDATRILLRHGFHEPRMQKCNSGCRSDNIVSQRLHEKISFKQEGVQRRCYFTNNRYYDQILYGLLKEEFEASDMMFQTGV